jgi:hypothetical protein
MSSFSISKTKIKGSRRIYSFIEVLRDYGGLSMGVEALASILMGIISAHTFLLKALSSLYVAETNELLFSPDHASNQKFEEKKAKLQKKLPSKQAERINQCH